MKADIKLEPIIRLVPIYRFNLQKKKFKIKLKWLFLDIDIDNY